LLEHWCECFWSCLHFSWCNESLIFYALKASYCTSAYLPDTSTLCNRCITFLVFLLLGCSLVLTNHLFLTNTRTISSENVKVHSILYNM
jgi:hypothetical protein